MKERGRTNREELKCRCARQHQKVTARHAKPSRRNMQIQCVCVCTSRIKLTSILWTSVYQTVTVLIRQMSPVFGPLVSHTQTKLNVTYYTNSQCYGDTFCVLDILYAWAVGVSLDSSFDTTAKTKNKTEHRNKDNVFFFF